jgi:hypothetical protein
MHVEAINTSFTLPQSTLRDCASARLTTRVRLWSCAGAALLALLLLPAGGAEAKGKPFEIRTATSRLSDGVWFANARIDYRLSDDALEALENGVSLTIQLQIEVTRVRRFWTDAKVASLKQGYLLSYQPLSERYVIKNLNSGEQNSFATLFSALNHMGRVVDLPLIDASILDPDARYEVAMRAILDQDTLPGPLRMIAFWSEGFRLVSNKYTWKLGD